MALEIENMGEGAAIDFASKYEKMNGSFPLSLIRRQTLKVLGILPRASSCKVFLDDGIRLDEDEYKKVIYMPAGRRSAFSKEEGLLDFAKHYPHLYTPVHVEGNRVISPRLLIWGSLTEQGRTYIKASFDLNYQIRRIELGFKKEEPGITKENNPSHVVFLQDRKFWRKRKV